MTPQSASDFPIDPDVLTEQDLHQFASALQRNGFFGPDSWYVNGARNIEYAQRSLNSGRLEMPVLFLHARYDYTCETVNSRLAQPMREYCQQLEEKTIACGHWMAQEKPAEVNAALAQWLARGFPGLWCI